VDFSQVCSRGRGTAASADPVLANTNFFFAAEAAYIAAKVNLPSDRVIFRQRARVIRKSWED
jgi:hypothetical protein